jgi:hypothetical protein
LLGLIFFIFEIFIFINRHNLLSSAPHTKSLAEGKKAAMNNLRVLDTAPAAAARKFQEENVISLIIIKLPVVQL